jgi:hypothetical protein
MNFRQIERVDARQDALDEIFYAVTLPGSWRINKQISLKLKWARLLKQQSVDYHLSLSGKGKKTSVLSFPPAANCCFSISVSSKQTEVCAVSVFYLQETN